MSQSVNDDLERSAAEVCEYFTGTDLETAILNNLEHGDLEMVKYLVHQGEQEIERQEQMNEASDVE